ncbi:MAG: PmoA family protein [Bacteroidota bacterium]
MKTLALPVLALFLTIGCESPSEDFDVTVDAGASDRLGTWVSFPMPDGAASSVYVAQGSDGSFQVAERDGSGLGWLLVDTLRAGERVTYSLSPASEEIAMMGDPDVVLDEADGSYALTVQRRPLLTYHEAPRPLPEGLDPAYQRGGYIYPLVSPSGIRITEDHPESHPHQHSLWFAWTRTAFQDGTPDFWNLLSRTATVVPQGVDSTWSGLAQGGFKARHTHVVLDGEAQEPVLDEQWRVQAYNTLRQGHHTVDLGVTQRNIAADTLLLREHHYGGLGLRGRSEWSAADDFIVLTSEGHDRSTGHATRARWAYIGGMVDTTQVGVVVMSHPTNPRHPEPMRIHPEVPFFNFAPIQTGPLAIAPNDTFAARYRLVTLDGPPDVEQVNRLWQDFATPPAVTVDG